jgi:hypothetical protein
MATYTVTLTETLRHTYHGIEAESESHAIEIASQALIDGDEGEDTQRVEIDKQAEAERDPTIAERILRTFMDDRRRYSAYDDATRWHSWLNQDWTDGSTVYGFADGSALYLRAQEFRLATPEETAAARAACSA